MNIIPGNSFSNAASNRGRVERDDQSQRTDRAYRADKFHEASGQSPEISVTVLVESFEKFAGVRYDEVDAAKERLNDGFYDDREQAIKLAESILDIS